MEVPVHLRGRQVELHCDPFDWSRVEVWYRERFAALARRCDKHLNARTYDPSDYDMSVENSHALRHVGASPGIPIVLPGKAILFGPPY